VDLVLEHGWAYGRTGTALRGKHWMHAITTGGRAASYARDGLHGLTMADFLVPLERTAGLCGCVWLPPFVVHGTHAATPDELRERGRDWRATLEGLRDGTLDLDGARSAGRTDVATLRPAPPD
jgi:glutathione-regulated potassium-efflux system ancillary protein KefG